MDFFLGLISIIGMTIPSALGYNLIFGKAKILHFGHAGLSIVNGYTVFVLLMATHSYPIALLSGIVSCIMVCAFFSWLSLRLDGDSFGILTVALHLMLLTIVLNWTPVTRGTLCITAIPRMSLIETPLAFAICSVAVSIFWILFFYFLDRSAFGRQVTALSEFRHSASSLG